MSRWYSWNSNDDDFATVGCVSHEDSLWMPPKGVGRRGEGPIRLMVIQDERGALPLSDFPYTGLQQPRLLSTVAWNVLTPYLSMSGETIPATIEGVEEGFYLWYPTEVGDCLDEDASSIYETLGTYRRVLKPFFREGAIPENPFVLKGFESQDVWVNSAFKRAVEESGLTGAKFRMTAKPVTIAGPG